MTAVGRMFWGTFIPPLFLFLLGLVQGEEYGLPQESSTADVAAIEIEIEIEESLSHSPGGAVRHEYRHGEEEDFIPSGLVKKYNAQNTIERNNGRSLNVHIVPHTHDDVGWLKTVEQYYWGQNNTIQNVTVNDILDTVIESLQEAPHRTFTYVEQKFFSMWWKEQPPEIKDTVRRLVSDGQLTFVNGGWCMHDEAATHYVGMIDQTWLGHSFLKQELGVTPTVGWQLDPFGHSSSQASLMTYKMGFDALYFGRIDYQDLTLRQSQQECEGLWNASTSWDDSTIFWGLTGSYHGNYGEPDGYCFDIHCDPPQHVIDMNQTMLLSKVQDFVMALREQSDRTKGDHIMLTFGSDFQYQRAEMNFANMDRLFNCLLYFQESNMIDVPSLVGPTYDKINIFYSSPRYYTECKHNETKKIMMKTGQPINLDRKKVQRDHPHNLRNIDAHASVGLALDREKSAAEITTDNGVEWTVKQDDFMPYSDCSHCFWTGYFVSRPALKRFERVSSSFLLAARQLEAMLDYTGHVDDLTCNQAMYELEDAQGVLQHHDGVSGTSKQHVAYDYAKRLQKGIDGVADPCIVRKIRRLLLGSEADSNDYLADLTYCQLLNETKCDISMEATARRSPPDGDEIDTYVVVYNSMARKRSVVVNLPVATSDVFRVDDMEGSSSTLVSPIPSLWKNSDKDEIISKHPKYVLTFDASEIPAMGAKLFRIQKEPYGPSDLHNLEKNIDDDGHLEISNGFVNITFDPVTGNIHRIGDQSVENLTSWAYYTSFDSDRHALHGGDKQNSGAYIFRPSMPGQKPHPIHAKSAKVIDTAVGVEVHVEYSEPWLQTKTRILKEKPFVEIEYLVGPIPIDDGLGKEIVVKYNTGVENDGIFYTDTNGREFVRRQRNFRPTWNMAVYEPVAGNYYPINAAIYMDDGSQSFSVVTDRTQGGGSITDGALEIMVHRRTVKDDARGVGEPINETDVGINPYFPWGDATRIGNGIVIKGTHRILVGGGKPNDNINGKGIDERRGGASLARSVMDDSFADPIVFVATASSSQKIPFQTTSFSGISGDLPENVMVITKKRLDGHGSKLSNGRFTSYLVRLGHQYGLDEDETLSKPIDVDLATLFPGQTISSVIELTLSGNRDVASWKKERLDWFAGDGSRRRHDNDDANALGGNTGSFKVTLSAMDIKTFNVTTLDEMASMS